MKDFFSRVYFRRNYFRALFTPYIWKLSYHYLRAIFDQHSVDTVRKLRSGLVRSVINMNRHPYTFLTAIYLHTLTQTPSYSTSHLQFCDRTRSSTRYAENICQEQDGDTIFAKKNTEKNKPCQFKYPTHVDSTHSYFTKDVLLNFPV